MTEELEGLGFKVTIVRGDVTPMWRVEMFDNVTPELHPDQGDSYAVSTDLGEAIREAGALHHMNDACLMRLARAASEELAMRHDKEPAPDARSGKRAPVRRYIRMTQEPDRLISVGDGGR